MNEKIHICAAHAHVSYIAYIYVYIDATATKGERQGEGGKTRSAICHSRSEMQNRTSRNK